MPSSTKVAIRSLAAVAALGRVSEGVNWRRREEPGTLAERWCWVPIGPGREPPRSGLPGPGGGPRSARTCTYHRDVAAVDSSEAGSQSRGLEAKARGRAAGMPEERAVLPCSLPQLAVREARQEHLYRRAAICPVGLLASAADPPPSAPRADGSAEPT